MTSQDLSRPTSPAYDASATTPLVGQDKYDSMLRLAAVFDQAGEELRARARLGTQVLADPDVSESAALSPTTYAEAETEIRAATTGKNGMLGRSIELDADALVVRATVLTYRWIDELQEAATKTLGSVAARAIGYLAPEVALGGAIVSAGLIETDALDRDGVAAYLNELAEQNPDLMDHVASGGGGLVDGLQMRSLLTAGVLAGEDGDLAARGGLRATGLDGFPVSAVAAVRDVSAGLLGGSVTAVADASTATAEAPGSLEGLMTVLADTTTPVAVAQVAEDRFIAYLPGPSAGTLRLVSGDTSPYAETVRSAVREALERSGALGRAHVMLVGAGPGGVAAAEIAASAPHTDLGFTVDQVVTVGAPSAQVPRIPETTQVLSLEDRSDPVALLGSLINTGVANRLTVVFDGRDTLGTASHVAGGRAADAAGHPDLRAAVRRIRELGYLAS